MDVGPSETRAVSSPSHPLGPGGFAPGHILADRYRIVALVGRGGMGEVYRADDLKLGQPVALKFLPAELERDPAARDRLLAEVRSARTISHPNVCRVYDVGDIGGRVFLTMEYIDGEDLASLLRRIGRLPAPKALEIARQLCAGLAAVHDRGMLHRDLKPANVMIDGRGQGRITDFGLAIERQAGAPAGDHAGTMAYMAPERMHGAAATVQSDLYALGLILYEACTGRPPFKAQTFEEWRFAHDSSAPTPPAELSGDIDPAIERVILRCLEKNPAKRPASALQVAAVLPGGDPLAAALAAGETPSPELVAASGEEGTLPRRTAWLLLGASVLVLAAFAVIWRWVALPDIVPFVGGPQVLHARARAVLASLGYAPAPRDSAWVIEVDPNQRRILASRDSTTRRFADSARVRPTLLRFRYRQSPGDLRPLDVGGLVTMSDPTPVVPGEALLELDTLGRLTFLRVVPSPHEPEGDSTDKAADWRPLLVAAGLSDVQVTSAAPIGVPPVAFDGRQAWLGTLEGEPFRLEAAAFRGRIVFARWGDPPADAGRSSEASTTVGAIAAAVSAILWILLLALVVLLARHNVKLGRGDRRGARRVALFVLVLAVAGDLASRHWVPDVEWVWTVISTKLGWSLHRAAFVWLAYLALEPLARRAWPHLLIGWSRLIDGRWRDPLVGQALLAGVLYGAVSSAAAALPETAGRLFNLAGTEPFLAPWALSPPAAYFPEVGISFTSGALYGLAVVAVMVIVRVALRAERAAFAATALAIAVFTASGVRPLAFVLLSASIIGAGSVWFLRRFGLLALAAGITVSYLLRNAPWTFDLTKWFAWRPVLSLILIMGLACWGFRNVLGRQSAFPTGALDG